MNEFTYTHLPVESPGMEGVSMPYTPIQSGSAFRSSPKKGKALDKDEEEGDEGAK